MNNQLKKLYKSDEENLYEINPTSRFRRFEGQERRTVPKHESNIWRSPLNYRNQQPWYQKEPKHYSEVEHIQHQTIFRESYEKAKSGNPHLTFMADSFTVLKKILEQESKTQEPKTQESLIQKK